MRVPPPPRASQWCRQPVKPQRLPEPPTLARPGTRQELPRFPWQGPGGANSSKHSRLNPLCFLERNWGEISHEPPDEESMDWDSARVYACAAEEVLIRKEILVKCNGHLHRARVCRTHGRLPSNGSIECAQSAFPHIHGLDKMRVRSRVENHCARLGRVYPSERTPESVSCVLPSPIG